MGFVKHNWLVNICFLLIFIGSANTAKSQHQRIDASQRPNIIFILTDDQRWDALGYAGNKQIITPEMDRLASEGAYFRNGIVTTPICAASRASIFSGLHERTHLYNFETGAIRNQFMDTSYPVVMQNAGYYTGFFGKFGVKYSKIEQLFDVADDYDRNNAFKDKRGYYYKTIGKDTVHLTRYTAQQGLDFIAGAPTDKPFCLQLSFSAPHAHDGAPDQYFWTNETDQLYKNVNMPPAALSADEYFNELPVDVRNGFNRLRWTWRFDTPEKYQHSVKGYYRMIADIDLEIGKIRKLLQQKGIDNNTIIILLGDNGYFLGERQLAGKWLMYDNSIRVPLIVFDPRSNKHRDIDQMGLNIDIAPTLADIAGVPAPKSWQGHSLMPAVYGKPNGRVNDTVLIEHLWEFKNIPPSEGVRTAGWKYFRYVNDLSLEYLYDLQEDRQETKNLAGSALHKAILVALREKTNALIKAHAGEHAITPEHLSTNFLRHQMPVIANSDTPVFAWQLPAAAGKQLAYQILVASSKATLDKNIGDYWNSGQVRSAHNMNVKYGGKGLAPQQNYYWKVRIWDDVNRTSAYSEPVQFAVKPAAADYRAATQWQRSTHMPKRFEKRADGYFIDFGKHAFGTILLQYKTDKAETLTIALGEKLINGTIDTMPGGSIRYQNIHLKVQEGDHSYLVKLIPDARNTKPVAAQMPDTMPVIMPFRYCTISNATKRIQSGDVAQIAYNTFFDDGESSFVSSDTILNQVYDLCKYSIKATSFTGLYIDGDRERIPYEADAYLNQLSHYAVDRDYSIARNTIAYFIDHPTWPTEWQLHVALMLEQDYWYTGDISLIRQYYDAVKNKSLIGLLDDNNLISTRTGKVTPAFMQSLGFSSSTATLRDIVDWPPADKDTEWKLATPEGERDGFVFTNYNTVVNAFFYKNLEILARFAEWLGKDEDAASFALQAIKTKQAINKLLLDEHRGMYKDGADTDHASLHANMLPLAFGIVPEKYKASVASFIKTRGMACSVYGSQYLLDGLYNAGEAKYALDLMTATHDRSWYNMIRVGATISLEAWDMKYKPNADWNHAWGAVPANTIARQLWGIQPMVPGGAIVAIRPQLASLTSTSITVPFLGGKVKASYQKAGALRQIYTAEVPANMAAEFFLPAMAGSEITLNGQPVETAFGSIRLGSGKHIIELVINTF